MCDGAARSKRFCTFDTIKYAPKKLQTAQGVVFAALEDSVQKVQSWEDTEYGRFCKKEVTLRLRALQYDKMTALRQENREAPLIEQDSSLWNFQSEEVMDESTATILDAHVAQLERELSILIYDIQDLENQGRGSQMRQLFVLFPKRLQEWEFFTQPVSLRFRKIMLFGFEWNWLC